MAEDQRSDAQLRQDALLTQYQEVRSELRQSIDRSHRRAGGGIAAIGVIVGYALSTDTYLFLTFVPIIMGFLYIISIGSAIGIRFLAKQSYQIEAVINIEEFSWETNYGAMLRENKRHLSGPFVNWSDVPRYATYVIGICVYSISVLVSIVVISNSFTNSSIQWPMQIISIIFYTTFTLILGFVWLSFVKVSRYIRDI